MISLFIDTSASDVSIALIKEERLLSVIHNNIPGEHSIYVTKYIENILKENKLTPNNINEIIVVKGPGSFTGIRIGVTISKVFAYLTKIRIVSITSLKAMIIGRKKSQYYLSLIDAKHNNYYAGLYDSVYDTIKEVFLPKDEVEKLIEEYHPMIIEDNKYNILQIVEYTKKLKSENPHSVNPIYLKLPEAMEKKNDKRN